jgi:secreted trypsin-like serine protease
MVSPKHLRRGWASLMRTLFALAALCACGGAANSVQAQSVLQQARQADIEASKEAPSGSAAFFSLRKPVISRLQSLLSATETPLPRLTGPPNVNDDPRFRANLIAMLRDSASGIQPRIFGGAAVPPTQFKEVVQLSGSGGSCTGTLIAPTVILTAGHCVCAHATDKAFFGTDSSRPASGRTFAVARSSPKTNCSQTAANNFVDPGNDFALLWLSTSPGVNPVTFVNISSVVTAHDVIAVGFGYTEAGTIGTKMEANIPIASPTCSGSVQSESDAQYYGCGLGLELVAATLASSSQRDTCLGDSGGPIYVRSNDGSFGFIGVTSRGVATPGAATCGDGGLYGLLQPDVMGWIVTSKVQVSRR